MPVSKVRKKKVKKKRTEPRKPTLSIAEMIDRLEKAEQEYLSQDNETKENNNG